MPPGPLTLEQVISGLMPLLESIDVKIEAVKEIVTVKLEAVAKNVKDIKTELEQHSISIRELYINYHKLSSTVAALPGHSTKKVGVGNSPIRLTVKQFVWIMVGFSLGASLLSVGAIFWIGWDRIFQLVTP